jgi:hypothetical protein
LILALEVVALGVGFVEIVTDDAAAGLVKRDFVVLDECGESVFDIVGRGVDAVGPRRAGAGQNRSWMVVSSLSAMGDVVLYCGRWLKPVPIAVKVNPDVLFNPSTVGPGSALLPSVNRVVRARAHSHRSELRFTGV